MAEFEVYGRRTYANDYEKNSQQQYDYFKAGNPKTFNNHNNVGSVVWAWSRSPYYDYYNNFVMFYADGTANSLRCLPFGRPFSPALLSNPPGGIL